MAIDIRLAMEETKQALIQMGHSVEKLDEAIREYEAQGPIMPGKPPDYSGVVPKLQALGDELMPTEEGHALRRMALSLSETQQHFEKHWGKS